MTQQKRTYVKVEKTDADLGLVFGFAIVCKQDGEDYFDLQGDHIPEDSMLSASTDFMVNSRVAKDMHRGEQSGDVVFAWPLTTEIAKAMGLTTEKTGLMIAVRPYDEDVLRKYDTGEYSGFSIGGEYGDTEELDD